MTDIQDAVLPDTQTTEEGRLYEKEIDIVLSAEKKDHPCYIGGLKIGSGVLFDLCSPIDPSIQYGSFQEPEPGTMRQAVASADKVAKEWSKVPVEERAGYFKLYLNGLKARRMHYAAMVTVATGMVREDAMNEVDSLIEALEGLISSAPGQKLKGGGVWAVITEHNSPLASPVAYAVGAMIAGNTVVMNPSNKCPLPILDFYLTMERFKLPDGVMNLVVDRDEYESTQELANDMTLRGVAASGSGDRMEDMMFLQIDDELKFINNLKGMSPAVLYRPGNMKEAVKSIVESAFSYSGQRIHSCSKVILTIDEQQKFVDALVEVMKDLRIGDPLYDRNFSGPIISKENAKKFKDLSYENAAFIIAKAPRSQDSDLDNYVSPIVISGLDEDNDLNFMDSGLPILNVKVVGGMEELFEELMDTECGMSAGVFSKDAKVISRFKETVDVPAIYVNESSRALSPVVGLDLKAF